MTRKIEFDIKPLPLARLVSNEGQIPDVPSNPRQLTRKAYSRLKRKLRELNFTNARPLIAYPMNEQYVVFCGNQRLTALREIGETEVMCAVIPADTPAADIRKILLADNVSDGEWTDDVKTFEAEELEWAGVDEAWSEAREKEGDGGEIDLSPSYRIEVTVDDEAAQAYLYNELTEKGYVCRILTL